MLIDLGNRQGHVTFDDINTHMPPDLVAPAEIEAWLVGRPPRPEELAERMEITVDNVRALLELARGTLSLETPLGDEADSHLHDIVEDENAVSPLEETLAVDLATQTNRILATLSPREEKILRLRFGLGDDADRTLEQVGQRLGVTRERIRQIESVALRKLRDPSRTKYLKALV